ncbi:MAG: response regulator transcription factor, partial [Woeseiaceae bacterium]|nr:response regulator transcription factor [Woeseiaceae bacterium]
MSKIKIALVDDHQLVRDGLKSMLSFFSDIEVVGEASDGRGAIELMRNADIDVMIMDIAMTGLNGLDATQRIVDKDPDAKILILSMYDSEEYIARSMQNGARGYMLKNAAPEEFEIAVRKVASGAIYLSPEIGDQMRRHLMQQKSSTDSLEILSSRQREILQAIAEGRSTREIAELLSISPKTVETHRGHLMQKLNIHEIAGLVRYA